MAQGRLRAAMHTFEQALDLASRHGGRVLRGTADMYVGRAGLHRELGDLAAARQDLARSREIGEHASLPQNAYRWRVVMAQVCEAEGDVEAAVGLLDEADRLYEGDFSPNVRPVPAVRARVWIRHGRVDDALAWAGGQGLSVEDEADYLREYEHVTLARALVADHARTGEAGSLDQALDLLDRLRRAAEDGHRHGSVIDIRVAEALAHQARGDLAAALASLEAALVLAAPEGYVRTFLDEGTADGGPADRSRRRRRCLGVRPQAPGLPSRRLLTGRCPSAPRPTARPRR